MPYYQGDYYRGDYYRGDPGLFSFLGKALGGIAKVVGGGLKSALGLTPPVTISSQLPMILPPRFPPVQGFSGLPGGYPPGPQQFGLININRPTGMGVDNVPSGIPALMAPGASCGRGFHLNKSRYVTRGGGTSHYAMGLQLHERGTVCVKTRRMNVGNARALRRALRRVSGFAKLVKRSRRAVARAASAVGVHHRGARGKRGAPSVRIVKAA